MTPARKRSAMRVRRTACSGSSTWSRWAIGSKSPCHLQSSYMSEGRQTIMKKSLVYLSLTCLLVGLLSLVGCKKEETTEETTPATTSTTTTTETTSTSSSDMGTGGAMGSDMGTGSSSMGTDNMGTGTTPPPAK